MPCNGELPKAPLFGCCDTEPPFDEGTRIAAFVPFHGHWWYGWDTLVKSDEQLDRIPIQQTPVNLCTRYRIVSQRHFEELHHPVFPRINVDTTETIRTDFQTYQLTTDTVVNTGLQSGLFPDPWTSNPAAPPSTATALSVTLKSDGWTITYDNKDHVAWIFGIPVEDVTEWTSGSYETTFSSPWTNIEWAESIADLLATEQLSSYPVRGTNDTIHVRLEWANNMDSVIKTQETTAGITLPGSIIGRLGCPDVPHVEWAGFAPSKPITGTARWANVLAKGKVSIGPPSREIVGPWGTGSIASCQEIAGWVNMNFSGYAGIDEFGADPSRRPKHLGYAYDGHSNNPTCNPTICRNLQPEPPPVSTGVRRTYTYQTPFDVDQGVGTSQWTIHAGAGVCPT